jgi:hypothetical protein
MPVLAVSPQQRMFEEELPVDFVESFWSLKNSANAFTA